MHLLICGLVFLIFDNHFNVFMSENHFTEIIILGFFIDLIVGVIFCILASKLSQKSISFKDLSVDRYSIWLEILSILISFILIGTILLESDLKIEVDKSQFQAWFIFVYPANASTKIYKHFEKIKIVN
ncbi:hypothetical protein A5866_002111 [Enterococcus sp. 12C11_DIV0727]|uniref:Uncharacterized protein n=1 Tax=Candidatus Enterococcus lemimoniae TaxID=1834167 RepID=A0ABZ2TB31_9ENTE|nr:hypothetical protein A5866_003322 [Enterococcus sp. 12C11_DIV0727]